MTTIWERIAGPKIEVTYKKIRDEYGDDAYNLAHVIAKTFITEGKGKSSERVVVALAGSFMEGKTRIHRSTGRFMYAHKSGQVRELVIGDPLMKDLASIAQRIHRDVKGGSVQGKIMRWMLPRFAIEWEIQTLSESTYQLLRQWESQVRHGDVHW